MKVLLYDIETSPNVGFVWGKYEQDVLDFKEEFQIISFACKWLDQKKVYCFALPDFKGYKKGQIDDRLLLRKLHCFLSKADVSIAHNGDAFDVKKANARFIVQGLKPVAPHKNIDTKKIAKRYFGFNSNKLDDLGRTLGVGRKIKHEGFVMWKECLEGRASAWLKMKKYNKQDVLLLERVYLKIRGWDRVPLASKWLICPICESTHLQSRGSDSGKRRYQCQSCFKWFYFNDKKSRTIH